MSLSKQTVIYGLGDALYKAVAFFLLPVYLRYLGPSDYGVIETLMVTRGLIVVLIGMGLPNAVFLFYYRAKNDVSRKIIISTIFFLCLFLQILIPSLFFLLRNVSSILILQNPVYGFYFGVLAANIFLASFRAIPLSLYRAQNKPWRYTIVNLSVSITTLLANTVFVVFLGKGVLGVLYGNLCGGAVGFLLITPTIMREIKLVFDKLLVKKIIIYSIPLGLSILPLTITFMADRYFIAHLANLHDLGIYALAYKLANIFKIFVIMPFMLAWGPYVFAKENDCNAHNIYCEATNYFVIIALIIVVAISIFQIDVVKMITADMEYRKASSLVPVICYAFFFYGLSNVVRGVGIRLSGKTYFTTIVMIVGMVINLCLNYVLIKKFGFHGSAYALLISFFSVFALSYFFSNRLYYIDHDIAKMCGSFFISVILVWLAQWTNNGNIHLYMAILARIVLMMFFLLYCYCFALSKDGRKKLFVLVRLRKTAK